MHWVCYPWRLRGQRSCAYLISSMDVWYTLPAVKGSLLMSDRVEGTKAARTKVLSTVHKISYSIPWCIPVEWLETHVLCMYMYSVCHFGSMDLRSLGPGSRVLGPGSRVLGPGSWSWSWAHVPGPGVHWIERPLFSIVDLSIHYWARSGLSKGQRSRKCFHWLTRH